MISKNIIAKRSLRYSEKNSRELKDFFVCLSEPYEITQDQADFKVQGVMFACTIEIIGLDEPSYKVYGTDSLQAVNLASNIEALIRRICKRYDVFWSSGDPYFEE